MEMLRLFESLKYLKENEHRIIYKSRNGSSITVTHTGKLSPTDFAVGLIQPGQKEFRPTHVRLLIDFYIKRQSNIKGASKLFNIIEEVYKGEDPEKYGNDLTGIVFPMQLDDYDVNLYVLQLLLIEQDFNFGPGSPKQSKMNPPREYLIRFIRWIASGDDEIDRIIFAAAGRKYPASKKYSTPFFHVP